MSKVDYKELRSAVVVITNEVDTTREFEISANVNVQGDNTMGAIDNGVVRVLGKKDGNIATFHTWGANNLNMSYNDAPDKCAVLIATEQFVEACRRRLPRARLQTW